MTTTSTWTMPRGASCPSGMERKWWRPLGVKACPFGRGLPGLVPFRTCPLDQDCLPAHGRPFPHNWNGWVALDATLGGHRAVPGEPRWVKLDPR
jgi:hypothetical protein